MGIEPTSEAWEASILPLYDARSFLVRAHLAELNNCTRRKECAYRAIAAKPSFVLCRLAGHLSAPVRRPKSRSCRVSKATLAAKIGADFGHFREVSRKFARGACAILPSHGWSQRKNAEARATYDT
jgi:hypothetical protein